MSAILLAALISILPAAEQRVVDAVAREYRLTENQKALLCAIRRAENGRPALAFGVVDRRCRTYRKQAQWTANTIRKRYAGDITEFARRWCPTDAVNWERNVRFFLRKQTLKTRGKK